MNLYHLRYFSVLAKLEHYTKAANVLSVTQPSLSYAISSLENELGVKLFEKDGRNIVLTKCGKVFYEDVEKALNMIDTSINKVKVFGRGEGIIDIALLRTLSTQTVPKLVKGFLDKSNQKNIKFNFHNSTGLTVDILQGLKERKYDIAFCSKKDNEPTINFFPIGKQELVLVVPLDHELAKYDEINLKNTLKYPQIAFSKRSALRNIIDNLFLKCGGKPHYIYSVEEDQAVAGLVATGFGVAVVPNMPILSSMPIKILKIISPIQERLFYMCTLKNVYQAPVIENFIKYVLEHSDI